MSFTYHSKKSRLFRLAAVSASIAWLVGCGGGSQDGSTSTSTSAASASSEATTAAGTEEAQSAATRAASPTPEGTAPYPVRWGKANAVYTDPQGRSFSPEQSVVNDKGDVFVTWMSRHTGASAAGQTDIWARQYSAKSDTWLEGKVVAVVPNTAEGRVQDVQLTTVGNDVFAVWEFALTETTFFSHGQELTEMVKPGRLYVSRLTQGEGNWSAAQQVPGSASRPTGKPSSWKVAPAGDQKFGVFWFSADWAYLGSFYSPATQAWGPVQELGVYSGSAPIVYNHSVDFVPLFNRQGTGIVSISNYTQETFSSYLDSATGQWSQVPLRIYRNTATIDEAGNVQGVEASPGATLGALSLRTYSAATRQVQGPVMVYDTGNHIGLDNVQLSRTLQGSVLTWSEVTGTLTCPFCVDPATRKTTRRALNVTTAGQASGAVLNLGGPYGPNIVSLWQGTQAIGPALLSVWKASCSVTANPGTISATECARINESLGASVRSPLGDWSASAAVPDAWPLSHSTYQFKTNRLGQGVLIQSLIDGGSTDGKLRVYATVLK